jgi:hypothetical protein
MDRKVLVGIASLALILTGFSVQKSCYFENTSQANEISATTPEDPYASEAALRHCRCQPRHWRAMIMQK